MDAADEADDGDSILAAGGGAGNDQAVGVASQNNPTCGVHIRDQLVQLGELISRSEPLVFILSDGDQIRDAFLRLAFLPEINAGDTALLADDCDLAGSKLNHIANLRVQRLRPLDLESGLQRATLARPNAADARPLWMLRLRGPVLGVRLPGRAYPGVREAPSREAVG